MYCTVGDLKAQVAEAVLIRLVDDEGAHPDSLDEAGPEAAARLQAAISRATDDINGYCLARYPVPFSPVPGVIRNLAVDLALYNLFTRRGYDEDSADRSVLDRYKYAVRTLENLAKGVITLGVTAPAPAAEVDIRSSDRVYSRPKLEEF